MDHLDGNSQFPIPGHRIGFKSQVLETAACQERNMPVACEKDQTTVLC
jgi:hypothetical protein